MGIGQKETQEPINVKYYLRILHSMQAPIDSKFKRQTKKKVSTNVSFISQFLLGADNPADIVVDIGDRVSKLPNFTMGSSTTAGFTIAGLVMSALDFIRVPLVYLICFLMKKPVPFTLNNNARWFYSGILLGLAITALVVQPIAPIIGFVGAGLALTVGLYLLGKTIWNRIKLGQEKDKVAKEIEQELLVINELQKEAKALEEALRETTNQEQIEALTLKIEDLYDRYLTQKEKINDLKNKKLNIEEKIKSQNTLQIVDRSVTISLASLSIVGLALSLFFPPVGAWLLLGVAIAGGAYVMGRLGIALGTWAYNKYKTNKEIKAQQEQYGEIHGSSLDIMIELKELSDNSRKNQKESEEPHTKGSAFFLSKLGGTKKEPSSISDNNSENDIQQEDKPDEPGMS